ncbi:MAG: hypothetical protein NXH97_10530 [Rhodobacteraceae bacterium]|nr:hypothetical protein [Paracoccaceae bacterium]
MPVLIVEHSEDLGQDWAGHLAQFDRRAILTPDTAGGFDTIGTRRVTLVVIDLTQNVGAAMALADYTAVRQPWAPVIFITPGNPWTDGDLLIHARNACAILGRDTPPGDLAAMIARHAAKEPT